jgi:4-hydroxy-3-methylbut-2-enyl diphosphate reductase
MITIAKTAGFCFGVARAVDMLEKMIAEGTKVATLGSLIHNPIYVDSLKQRGVIIAQSIDEVPEDYTLVLRTHGVPLEIKNELDKRQIKYIDATCPFVRKIQNIVFENTAYDTVTLIAGDKVHPEVVAIKSYCKGECMIFGDLDELENIVRYNSFDGKKVIVVSQTTFNVVVFESCVEYIKEKIPDAIIYNTICKATEDRQEEARKLSKESDLMIVLGGSNSSNTKKLGDVCQENTKTLVVESAKELQSFDFSKYSAIGITAGASTPSNIIDEMNNLLKVYKKQVENST